LSPYILALDLGTAGCKAVIFSIKGEIIASGYDSYPISQQRAGWVEQDPEAWWESSIRASREALRNSKIDSSTIKVIGVTGQMSGIVPLDEKGSPLRPSIIWMDRRAVSQAERLRKHLGSKYLYEITGHRIDPAFFAVKALWIKENEPEIFKRTHIFLMPKDYLRFRLTGLFATDYGDASGSMLLDLRKKDWSGKLLADLNIPPEKLPILKSSKDRKSVV
jgi:xylulokinase